MKATNSKLKKIIRASSSVRLAVVIIISLAVIISIGTFVEAQYNASIASKLVYRTPWMFAIMGLLVLNLVAVMVDRWPWKRRHLPFLLAHVGIIVLLFGGLLTMLFGVDGTMYFKIGSQSRSVQVNKEQFSIWSTMDGDHYIPLVQKEVDFYLNPPPRPEYEFDFAGDRFSVIDYWPFATASTQVSATDNSSSGAALRFQIQNGRANVTDWLVQRKPGELVTHDFGPAELHLGPVPEGQKKSVGKNEIYLESKGEGKDSRLHYHIFYRDEKRPVVNGLVAEGGAIQTGWMGMELKVLRYFPHAEEKWKVEKLERPTATSTSAVKVKYGEHETWVQLDDSVRFFGKQAGYVIAFGHSQLDLGFDLHLDDFQMGTYPGTNRAASYQSVVTLPSEGAGASHLISMNEPLHYQGYTLYQASFQNDDKGRPSASILSVNRDPGRYFKYLGAFILTFGIVYLFYDRRKGASNFLRREPGSTSGRELKS